MKKQPISRAVGDILVERGFRKSGRSEWIREIDGYVDQVDTQIASSLDQITINLKILDEQVRSVIRAAYPENPFAGSISPVHVRLPIIMTGYDQWWSRSDPDTPRQMAEAIGLHALPFFESLHSAEAMLVYLQARGSIKWRAPEARINVALILDRLGHTKEAIAALSDPPRRVSGPWLDTVEALRRYVAESEGA